MAPGSKKLPPLYNLICSGRHPNRSNAYWICRGMAPGGTRSVSVVFHKSHIKQCQGHSLFVSKIVPDCTTRPEAALSSSRKNPCGLNGSCFVRPGRCPTIHSVLPVCG